MANGKADRVSRRTLPELSMILGTTEGQFVRRTLSFSLAQDIACTIPGFTSVGEIRSAISIASRFEKVDPSESAALAFGKEGSAIQFRRICGRCLPCPTKIAVSDILCWELNARHYGLKDRAKQQYGRQRVKADSCTKCGECTEKCPHGLPAMDLALRAGSTFA